MPDNAVSRSRGASAARLARGWIVAVLAVFLAAGGHQAAHTLMHGTAELIRWELLGFSAALSAPLAVALASKRISTWSTGLITIFGQVAFHTLYSLPSAGAPNHHDVHGPHHVALLSSPHATHMTDAVATTTADAVMVLAHFLAAALTTFVVMHGERSLGAIVAWLMLQPVTFVLATLPISIARPKPVAPASRVWIPHPMNVAQTRWTRGPPVLA